MGVSLILRFSALVVVLVLSVAFQVGTRAAMTGMAAHGEYAGFAEPQVPFGLSSPEMVFQETSGEAIMDVESDDFAVYRYGYVSYDGKPWEMFELSGGALGGDWLNGSVSAQIEMEASDFGLTQSRTSASRNFVVVYSCSRAAGGWDCHGGWQIWQFNASLAEEQTPSVVVYAVNAGGNAFVDASGISYSADTHYSGGSALVRTGSVAGTADDSLYLTERWGDMSYSFPVPDGSYEVTLKFMEGYASSSGVRVFDTFIEGARVIDDLDIFSLVGSYTAYDRTFDTEVTDGSLDITFAGSVNHPQIGAIVIKAPPEQLDECDVTGDCLSMACQVAECVSGGGYGTCSYSSVGCVDSDGCCPSGCTHGTDSDCEDVPEFEPIDVIGPHEFWSHENAQDGDYVGYVKYFDMDESLDPSYAIVAGNDGSFTIDQTGLIRIGSKEELDAGGTYNLDVKIEDASRDKSSTTTVVVHMAEESDVIYLDSSASNSGEDGSYEHPFTNLKDDIGNDNLVAGKVYLLKRGGVFPTANFEIDNPDATASRPVVLGAYGTGSKPILDGSSASAHILRVGRWSTTDPPDATGYLYVQNINFRNSQNRAITNGAYVSDSSPTGPHHLTFLDIEIHDTAGTSIFWWSRNQHDYNLDHDIKFVNLLVEGSVNGSGSKIYAGGVEVYNLKSYGHKLDGFRILHSGTKLIKGAEIWGSGTGLQMRANDTLVEYVKIHGNGGHGIEIWCHAENNGLAPGEFSKGNFTIRNSEIYDNGHSTNPYSGGVWIYGMTRDVVLDNVSIYDNYGAGVYIYSLYDKDTFGPWPYSPVERVTIKDSGVHDNAEEGIFVHEVRDFFVDDVFVENNRIYNNGKEAIRFENLNGGSVRDNVIYGNGVDDIVEAFGVSGVVKSGNQFL